jgi:hypothetical protein
MDQILRIFAMSLEDSNLEAKFKSEITNFLKVYQKSGNFSNMVIGLQENLKTNLLNSIL